MWDVLAQQDAGQGEQVPGNIERQAHPEGVPAIELLLVILAGEGEELVGQQKTQAQPPAGWQPGEHRAHRQAVEQVLRSQQQGRQEDREQVGPALDHADRHQLGGAGKNNG
ncbi:hypothetical protein D9M71_450260 [compost metagenome]